MKTFLCGHTNETDGPKDERYLCHLQRNLMTDYLPCHLIPIELVKLRVRIDKAKSLCLQIALSPSKVLLMMRKRRCKDAPW